MPVTIDDAVKQLARLFLTRQTYVEGLAALSVTPRIPTPCQAPTPAPRPPAPRRPPTPAPRQPPTPTPAERDAYIEEILSQMPGERPTPAPRRRRPIPRQRPIPSPLVFRRTRWTMGEYLRGWKMDVSQGHPDGADPRAFYGVRPPTQAKVKEEIKALNGVKFQLALKIQLRKDKPDGSEEYVSPEMRPKQGVALQNSEIDGALNQAFPAVQETLEKWTQRGSGWMVEQLETLWLDIAKYQLLRGGSYVPLTAGVKRKKAVVNVKNRDPHCLRWSLRSALFQARSHVDRPSKYPTDDGLNFEGIDAPAPISQVPKVELQNNLAINVFGWDKGVIVYHLSKQPKAMPRINLLLIEKAGNFHYTWIKNFNRLLYDQSKHKERKHLCERCLHGYTREDLLEAHKPECRWIGQTGVRVEMPEEGKNKLAFQNHTSSCQPLTSSTPTLRLSPPKLKDLSSTPRRAILNGHNTMRLVVIATSSFGLTARQSRHFEYRGPNATEHFLESLQEEERKIKGVLANPQALRMTRGNWRAFRTAETCHVCDKPLEGDSVRDHCHITGKYRRAAHTACNLKLRLNPKTTAIPMVFHNLRRYDSHLLMQAISVEGGIGCIPNNTEKYISFSLRQLCFIDSAQFLLASLDKLVTANPPEAFRITAQHEPNRERRELLMRKGVYPYEYMDTWDRFTEPKLPPKEVFYSKLSDAHISDEDYAHAQKVWETFGCKTLGDYSDLYCRIDVLLLADVFETFRRTCQEQYGLDPAHYYTSPGLSWDALLKKTGVELELLTDYDQHLFIEKGMRGGISMA